MLNNTTSQIDSYHQCKYKEQMETVSTLVVGVIFLILLTKLINLVLRQLKK